MAAGHLRSTHTRRLRPRVGKMSTMPHRRRIDQVLDAEFVVGLDQMAIEDLRDRRQLARDVENELSYYRRLFHGRLDLLAFEQRRRRGEESRSLIDALPSILADTPNDRAATNRHSVAELPSLPESGRREVDAILGHDVLLRLDEIEDAEIEVAMEAIRVMAEELSETRLRVQQVEDALSGALSDRYRNQAEGVNS